MKRISLSQQEDYLLKISILTEAKKIFNPKKHSGICAAIIEASDYSPRNPVTIAGDYLTGYISDQLEGFTFLDAWLRIYKSKKYKYRGKTITKIRKDWLQWMIDSYEERLK